MARRRLTAPLTCALFLLGAAPAVWCGISDLNLSTLTTTAVAEVSICNLPGGGGMRLDGCYLFGGGRTDATITLTLLDAAGSRIYRYPWTDMWIETADAGLVFCHGGTCSEGDTDALGQTRWRDALYAGRGGAGTIVVVSGVPLSQAPLPIRHNSPDLDGDLVVDVADLALYAADLGAGYSYRSDFYWDGRLDLSDFAIMARGYGSQCP